MTTTHAQLEPDLLDGSDLFRLSFAQERIWFLEQLDPGTETFTISTALRAAGPLDVDALRRALDGLIARHETLRTRFVDGPDGPMQEVLPSAEPRLHVVDGNEDALEAAIDARAENPTFELTRAPLLDVTVTRAGDARAVVTVRVHHIICDGPSADILWRDLTALYRAETTGAPLELPELPVQYADYAEWQRDTIDESVLAVQLGFWRAELAGTTGRCELPTDRPRPAVQDNLGSLVQHSIGADRAARLLDVARAEHVSPFMLVLAAYELALLRTTGRADFCVGTSIAGRTQQEVEDVLGCFLNLMPLRSDTVGNPSLRQLLERVRRRCLRAYANADLPFERLVDDLAPERDLSRPPLFDVLLAVSRGRSGTVEIGDVSLTPVVVPTTVARYDLALDVEIDESGIDMLMCFATSLFDEPTAQLLTARIDDALAGFEDDLDRRLSEVEIRADVDPVPAAPPVKHEVSPARCTRTLTTAVRELAGNAAHGAVRWVTEHGVQPGDRVAVVTESVPERLAAVFAIQQAGAAALVLDGADPAPWRDRMTTALGARLACRGGFDDAPGSGTVAHLDPRSIGLVAAATPNETDVRTWTCGALAVAIHGVADVLAGSVTVRMDGPAHPMVAVVVRLAAHLAGCEVVADDEPAAAVVMTETPSAAAADALRHAGTRLIVLCCPAASGVPYGATVDGRAFAAFPGIDVSCLDDAGATALPAALGEIELGGAAPLTAGGRRTGDLVRWVHGAPVPVRRAGGDALVGGHAVHPQYATDVLRARDDVDDAATVMTERGLVSFVTPQTADLAAAADAMAEQLPRAQRAVDLVALSRLPHRRDGELDTAALLSRASAPDAPAGTEASGPRNHVERALLDCFSESLDYAGLSIYDDFFACGGTSLAAARLAGAVSDAVGVHVPLKLLFQHPSVAELAEALATDGAVSGRLTALQAAAQDQVLPEDIAVARQRTGPARTVFLTGATGFVGSHLLVQLLAHGIERVTCLVRGTDPEHCRRRVAERLDLYGLRADLDRVDVVHGDLEEPWLGLGESRFRELAEGCDAVYHLGAHMNFFRPYRVLQAPNVRGTREIVRFACAGTASTLHYVSTVDSQAGQVLHEAPLPIDVGKDDGYVLTKKTAEQLVLEAGRRGLPIAIYRPWQITSHSTSGAVNPLDQLALCLTGILLTGVAPSDNPLPLHMLPVDQITDVLADVVDRIDPDRPIHHFYNDRVTPIETVVDVVRECGYPVETMPYRQWRVEVVRRTANRIEGLSALLANDASSATLPDEVRTENLESRLGYVPEWPVDDRGWVRRTIEFLARTGVVPGPAGNIDGGGV